MSSTTDSALVARIVARDQRAYALAYRAHDPAVRGIALKILRDGAEADDIVQETFLHLWKNAEAFDATRGSLRSWLVHFAWMRAIDRVRTRRRERAAGDAAEAEAAGAAAAPPPARPALEPVEEKLERARVQDAIAALPAEQRRALESAAFEGRTAEEIARAEGVPVATVYSRLRLARERLVTWMEGRARRAGGKG